MISSGHIPATWTQHTILNLGFQHRKDPASSFELLQPNDKKTYQQSMAIDHCSAPDLDKVFSIENQFSWLKNKVYAVHRLGPGGIVPFHKDAYKKYQVNQVIDNVNQIYRIVVFLEDWKDGHILQVGSHLYAHWKAGDFSAWFGETVHMAANLGHEDRYTLQITGTIIE